MVTSWWHKQGFELKVGDSAVSPVPAALKRGNRDLSTRTQWGSRGPCEEGSVLVSLA